MNFLFDFYLFLQNNCLLRWCPSPNCRLIIQADHLVEFRRSCQCDCGQKFCFSCGDEHHDPLPCKMIANWKKDDNLATLLYLSKHTKRCGGCTMIIGKGDDGNYVVRRFCSDYFSIVCFQSAIGWGDSATCNDSNCCF